MDRHNARGCAPTSADFALGRDDAVAEELGQSVELVGHRDIGIGVSEAVAHARRVRSCDTEGLRAFCATTALSWTNSGGTEGRGEREDRDPEREEHEIDRVLVDADT